MDQIAKCTSTWPKINMSTVMEKGQVVGKFNFEVDELK